MMDGTFSCTQCGVLTCRKNIGDYPQGCLTEQAAANGLLIEAKEKYDNDPLVLKVAQSSAKVESEFYCAATRVEEIIQFCRKIDAKKIGIATCAGLIKESKVFAKILQANGLVPCGVICKVGSQDKSEIGIAEEYKIRPGCHEPMCNPILQALTLNREKTDLNVIVGLCVGHDSLFIKYSEALVTSLITKDRVLGHNPAAALYTADGYYRKLMTEIP